MKDTNAMTPSATAEEALRKFIGKAGNNRIDANSLVRELVQLFLESYINGQTRRSLSAFYTYLTEEFSVSFSYDSLRRYCKRHHTKLWNAYKEVKNVQI